MDNKKPLLIVVLGPTASGKSDLAVKLAKKFNGEIISADSRQIYKGMDIGTGKITSDTKNFSNFSTGEAKKKYTFTHKGIPHYCIDVASPKRRFTVSQYRKMAIKAINKIFKKKRLPIICGGTGFYIQAVTDGITIPEIPPDWKLRKKLEKKSVNALYQMLKKIDYKRAETIERKNPRRLIRAIEIILKTKKAIPPLKKNPLLYPVLIIGIKKPFPELKKLIKKRFLKWLKTGLIAEVKKLRKSGLSWKRIEDFGIHYRVAVRYLQNKLTKKEMIENSIREIQNYAKRQLTWFKRDKKIKWIRNYGQAEKLIKEFLEIINTRG